MKFDFDEWAELAKQDKVAFERKRAVTLHQAITSCASNEQELRKLNGLQFQIDMIRRKHKTAMGACIAITEKLMDQFYLLITLDIDTIRHNAKKETDKKLTSDNVIPFHAPRKHNSSQLKQK